MIEKLTCPLCNDPVDKLLYRFHYESEKSVIDKIKELNPAWTETDGICSRCVDYYQVKISQESGIIPEIGPHFPVKSSDDFVIIPTPLRLEADPKYSGRGITICFIDSGFYPHPDLTNGTTHIKAMVDVTGKKVKTFTSPASFSKAAASQNRSGQWHGTMTTVVCAGNGSLSRGLYKGIASDAHLVLVKTMNDQNKITSAAISKALTWVLKNHNKYNIRIVNISLGDDEPTSYKTSIVDQLAEKIIAEGITIVAAVGNDEQASIKPPANALNVIAVGGIDDQNKVGNETLNAYHSSYGKTVDDLSKPELTAHAIWIAAPILPKTDEHEEARVLYHLTKLEGEELLGVLKKKIILTKMDKSLIHETSATVVKDAIINRIQQAKYISADYMHVDGTSFAAPIVTSVIAQMLEANPILQPQQVREILFRTARKIPGLPIERQGFGVINARKALMKVLQEDVVNKTIQSPVLNTERNTIQFYLQDHCASKVALAGSFNEWSKEELLFEPVKNGIWKIEIPMLPPGKHCYKFLIDGTSWHPDIFNSFKEPDGYNDWNSILYIDA